MAKRFRLKSMFLWSGMFVIFLFQAGCATAPNEKATVLGETHPERAGALAQKTSANPKEYVVSPGDILDISVWQWPDLRVPEVYVRPDGKISFPLVGDIQALDRTLTEIDDELTEKLKEYIKTPEVSISIRRFGGKKVIVLGEVGRPGVYAPTGTSTVLEVIALAGGFSGAAVTTNVMVIRGDTVKSEAVLCDIRRAMKEGDLRQNILVQSNDIVYVPKRMITNVTDFAREVNALLSTMLVGAEVGRDLNVFTPSN